MTKVIISKEHYDALITAASIADKLDDVYEDSKKERKRLFDEIDALEMNMKQFWAKRFTKVRLKRLEKSREQWNHVVDIIEVVLSGRSSRSYRMKSKYPCEPLDESSNQTTADNPAEPDAP